MNTFALAGLLTGLSSLIFGLFVLFHNSSRNLNRIWCIFTFTVATWGFGAFGIALAKTPEYGYFFWKVAFGVGVTWIPVFFFHFVYIFCQLKQRAVLWGSYLLGAIFSALAFTPYFFSGVRYIFDSFYYGVPYFKFFGFFVTWWIGLTIYSHYRLIVAYKISP